MIIKVDFDGKTYQQKGHAELLREIIDQGMSVTLCKLESGDYMATGVYSGKLKHCITINTQSAWHCLAVVAMVFDNLKQQGRVVNAAHDHHM